jgi:hypothetical protein
VIVGLEGVWYTWEVAMKRRKGIGAEGTIAGKGRLQWVLISDMREKRKHIQKDGEILSK